MKLLILTHNFPPRRALSRNAGAFVLSFALNLSRLGHKVYVLMPDTGEEKEIYPELNLIWFNWRGKGKELRYLSWYRPGDILNIFSLIRNGLKAAVKVVREEDIEYCQAMWIIPGGYFCYKLKKRFGVPYSIWVLGADIWTYSGSFILRKVMRKIIHSSHRVFCNSEYLSDEVKDIFKREPKLLYAVRDLPLNTPAAALSNSFFNFLFIGRYELVKGLDVLLRAFRLLLDEGRDIYLYAFGGGELETHYRVMINELNLGARVSLGCYASPEIAVSFMKACPCLIIPSRQESQPVILMDAIQAKVPLIVTDVGDMAKIVRQFNIGIVAANEDVQGLKMAMAEFMDNDTVIYRQNLEKLSQRLNIKSICREYIEEIG